MRIAQDAALPPPVAGPLSGLLVVEVTQHCAGPLAARVLADYGASVIKWEPQDGDPFCCAGKPASTRPAVVSARARARPRSRTSRPSRSQTSSQCQTTEVDELAPVAFTSSRMFGG